MGYDAEFFRTMGRRARTSAAEVAPLVLDLVTPRSIVDVGCGTGDWLAVFRQHGVEDLLGIDGDWVDKGKLSIPGDRFLSVDLTRPLRLDRRFDLVVCLEVAEHLPEQCADAFVDSLCGLGDLVLFSAAIPFQGGVHHVNEQWPDYWAGRFGDRSYVPIDCLRARFWNNPNVEWFYAQNMLIYVRQERLEAFPRLGRHREAGRSVLSLVHPRRYFDAMDFAERMAAAAGDIAATIPPGQPFILVDQDQIRPVVAAAARVFPFMERNGAYWGPPPDDRTAIAELERLRAAGAGFIVFAWPAFWWLDHYSGMAAHLRTCGRCLLKNDRVVIFDLSPADPGQVELSPVASG